MKFEKQKDRKFEPYPLNEKRFEIMQLPSIHVQGQVSLKKQTSERNFDKYLLKGFEGFSQSKPFYDTKIPGKSQFTATIRNPKNSISQLRQINQKDQFNSRYLQMRDGRDVNSLSSNLRQKLSQL